MFIARKDYQEYEVYERYESYWEGVNIFRCRYPRIDPYKKKDLKKTDGD